LTELILENTFGEYEPEEVVALLSCFVFQERTDGEPIITPRLELGREAILAIAGRVGTVQDKNKVVAEEHRGDLKFGLIEVVYEWAKGTVSDHLYCIDRNNSCLRMCPAI
jgi:antiviral helicase SKI2